MRAEQHLQRDEHEGKSEMRNAKCEMRIENQERCFVQVAYYSKGCNFAFRNSLFCAFVYQVGHVRTANKRT